MARCLYERVVACYGVTRSILSDRGGEFTGQVWESLMGLLGSSRRLTSPYYPQGNAVLERSHRTINNMLRALLLERKDTDWSILLPTVMLYINNMIQEGTGHSACEILFGENLSRPSDLAFSPTIPIKDDLEGYVKQLKRELRDLR